MYEELKSNLRQWVNCSEAELESYYITKTFGW